MCESYAAVPTQLEARQWSARMLAYQRYDWDTIAEGFHPEGWILSQEGCDVIVNELFDCSVTLEWPDGTKITYASEDR